ncbi:hypothetical protein B0H13DRAFT_2299351 [Mycena leptocephala]|nr:hypothetical protein B0H13DRAFT_2299351 [Mycena leptocephala]
MFLGVYALKPINHYLHIGPILPGCYALDYQLPRLFTFYAIPSFVTLAKSCSMFAMTLYKCGLTILTLGHQNTPLFTLFLRDGVFWFLALVLVSVEVVVVWHTARQTLSQIPVVLSTGLIAIIGSRVVLNIKRVLSDPDADTTTTTLPTIVFDRPAGDSTAVRHEDHTTNSNISGA